jgi:hypothetical protein
MIATAFAATIGDLRRQTIAPALYRWRALHGGNGGASRNEVPGRPRCERTASPFMIRKHRLGAGRAQERVERHNQHAFSPKRLLGNRDRAIPTWALAVNVPSPFAPTARLSSRWMSNAAQLGATAAEAMFPLPRHPPAHFGTR